MTIYAIEMGDAWLSGASMELVGFAESFDEAVNMILKNGEIDDEDEQRMELHMHGQTYGLENNYIIREFETGEWME